MDTEIEIKEEGPLLDDMASQNEREFFTWNITNQPNGDVLLPDNHYDTAIKTEIKPDTSLPNFCLQQERECFSKHHIKQINSEAVICNINSEMNTKIETKEEDPLLDDIASQNERGIFPKNVTMKPKNDALLLDNDCDIAIKTEITSDASFSKFCLQQEMECFTKHHIKQIKSETVTCNINSKVDTKTELDSQNNRAFLPEYFVMTAMKYNSDHEIDYKIEIKEEPWWPETETSSACNDKDADFTSLKSPRLCTKAVCGDNRGDSPLPSTEASGKNTGFSYKNDCSDHENQESEIKSIPSLEKHVHLEKSGKYNEGKSYSKALLIHKVKRSYKCEICEQNFTCLAGLKRHNLTHEGKKPHKCQICGKSFTQLSYLKLHNLKHEGKKPHKCAICEKSFTWLSHLKSHSLIHEGKQPHKCDICKKSFTQMGNLKLHYLIHEGKKPHRSKICEKRFTQLSYLKLHNLIHEAKQPHKCGICEKSFTRLSHLKRHNFTHNGEKPHKCEICGTSFSQLADLKRHNLIHEGKRYKCQFCEKSFSRLSTLKLHNLKHEGIKPHKCETCSKSFTEFSSLKRHKLIHKDEKPQKCTICEKRFTLLSSLKLHNLIHEGKQPHKCGICEKSFTRLSHLRRHKLIHEGTRPHKCKICEKGFTRLSHLKIHNFTHYKRPRCENF